MNINNETRLVSMKKNIIFFKKNIIFFKPLIYTFPLSELYCQMKPGMMHVFFFFLMKGVNKTYANVRGH